MRLLESSLERAVLFLFVIMIVLVTIQVGNRVIVQQPIPWTEEMTRIAYVVLIFVGSVLAAVKSEHIRVTVVYEKFPKPVRRGLHLIFGLLSAGFMGIVAYGAYVYALVGWTAALPTVSWITMGYVMALMMISAIAMGLTNLWWTFTESEPRRMCLIESALND
jgi:TRAP-type C4-dicarboxylate transport system permease small subunit